MTTAVFMLHGDTCFDNFTVIREPLPTRESRVLGRQPNGNGGCDYGSHSIKLATCNSVGDNSLYLLMENGSGREVMALKTMYDGGVSREALSALPDVALYGVLYMMWDQAKNAARNAEANTRREWAMAHLEKRIKTTRRNNRKYVDIVPVQQLAPATA